MSCSFTQIWWRPSSYFCPCEKEYPEDEEEKEELVENQTSTIYTLTKEYEITKQKMRKKTAFSHSSSSSSNPSRASSMIAIVFSSSSSVKRLFSDFANAKSFLNSMESILQRKKDC